MDWNYQMNDIAECGRHGTFVSWFEKLALKLTKELISEAEAKENEKNEISDNGGDDDEDGKKKKKRKPKKKKKPLFIINPINKVQRIVLLQECLNCFF